MIHEMGMMVATVATSIQMRTMVIRERTTMKKTGVGTTTGAMIIMMMVTTMTDRAITTKNTKEIPTVIVEAEVGGQGLPVAAQQAERRAAVGVAPTGRKT
jgi:hypothetical protein